MNHYNIILQVLCYLRKERNLRNVMYSLLLNTELEKLLTDLDEIV